MTAPMNCLEFEQRWNDRLDTRQPWPIEVERAVEAHAAACPDCRALGIGFQMLAQLVAQPDATLQPSPGFADRVIAAHEASTQAVAWRIPLPRAQHLAALAAAAALVVAVGLLVRSRQSAPVEVVQATPVAPADPVRAIDPAGVTAALSEATSATLSLAWQASAPAARVGREIWDEAELSAPAPRLALPDSAAVVPASDVLQEVGERVNAGVRPFSGTARSAFGFLLGPATGRGDAARPVPNPRGA